MKKSVLSLLITCLCLPILTEAVQAADLLKPVSTTANVPTLSTSIEAQGYTLRSGDQIRVEVVDFPDLTKETMILPDGTINVTYLGSVRAAGRTPDQLTDVLTQRFRGIIRKPVVSVSVLRTRPIRVNVVGEVQRPGPQIFIPQNNGAAYAAGGNVSASQGVETVTSALSLAGGITSNADVRKVTLIRQTSDGPVEKNIDLWQAMRSGDFSRDYTLNDGDTVKVPLVDVSDVATTEMIDGTQISSLAPQQLQVQVVGEVKTAGVVNLSARNSTVLNALGLAGGPTNEADYNNIVVARLDRTGKVERTPLDLNKLADGREKFQMRNGDVVLVGRRGISQFGQDVGAILNPIGNVLRLLTFGMF